jgi:hypothetical protein
VSERARLRRVSFGSTSAVVTSIGLVVGFGSLHATRASLIASLLIIGIADNLTDSLSIHLYQESEGLDAHEALVSTVSNFVTRLAITATFVVLAATLAHWWLIVSATAWGLGVLGTLTVTLAHERQSPVRRELLRHFAIAVVVIALSRVIGSFVGAHVS